MSVAASQPPNLRKARRRDIIAELRAKRADEYERNPKREREAMLRFLAYLKPSAPLFVIATLCGIANYTISALVHCVTG